jgi:hypothetical protein
VSRWPDQRSQTPKENAARPTRGPRGEGTSNLTFHEASSTKQVVLTFHEASSTKQEGTQAAWAQRRRVQGKVQRRNATQRKDRQLDIPRSEFHEASCLRLDTPRSEFHEASRPCHSHLVCNAIFAFDNFCCCLKREKVNEGSDALARLRAAERAK